MTLLTSVSLQSGMAQRGVPIIDDSGEPGVIASVYGGGAMVGMRGRALASLRLDLTTPLGRAVGWAWLEDQDAGADLAGAGLTARDALRLLDLAMRWRPMTPAQVDRFARLILAVGGEGA